MKYSKAFSSSYSKKIFLNIFKIPYLLLFSTLIILLTVFSRSLCLGSIINFLNSTIEDKLAKMFPKKWKTGAILGWLNQLNIKPKFKPWNYSSLFNSKMCFLTSSSLLIFYKNNNCNWIDIKSNSSSVATFFSSPSSVLTSSFSTKKSNKLTNLDWLSLQISKNFFFYSILIIFKKQKWPLLLSF